MFGDTSRLDPNEYYGAAAEVLCVLLHLTDRDLFRLVPYKRDSRMDALVASVTLAFARQMAQDGVERNAMGVAGGIFHPLYAERMDEYGGVGDDWLNRVLSEFGKHFSSRVNGGVLDFRIYAEAQAEACQMYSALREVVPELFRP
jgi:hypothetical protein